MAPQAGKLCSGSPLAELQTGLQTAIITGRVESHQPAGADQPNHVSKRSKDERSGAS